jgi:hypothetical protein
MRIRGIAKECWPRLNTLPGGGLTSEDYDKLRSGMAVEVPEEAAAVLIGCGKAVAAPSPTHAPAKDGD